MLSEIDNKVLLAVAVVVGLLTGYVVNNSIVSGPKINSIYEENSELQNQISELVSDKQSLEDELDDLQNDYNSLETSLISEIDDLESEISELEDELQIQQDLLNFNELYVDELNTMLNELNNNLSGLEEKYAELYNPLYSQFTIGDLSYNISVKNDRYPDNLPVEGTVEIEYLNGTEFKGTFKLEVRKVYVSSGAISDPFEIDGIRIYRWAGAFALGSGSYKLSISDVKNDNGDIIVSNNELKKHPLYLFVG